MYDSIPEIADDLRLLRQAMEGLKGRIEIEGCDPDHVISKLSDYSEVLVGLHDRLIVLNRPTRELPAVDSEREGIRGISHDSTAAGGE